MTGKCTVEPCGYEVMSRSLCRRHYHQARREGTLQPLRKASLEERFWEKVEITPYCWLWRAGTCPKGYGMFWVGKSQSTAHNISWKLYGNTVPKDKYLDHRCYEPSCVNPGHLRLVTNKQNQENQSGLRTDNSSGHRGVTYKKKDSKWLVQVKSSGKLYYGGYYPPYELHVAAYRAIELRGKLFTHNDSDPVIRF